MLRFAAVNEEDAISSEQRSTLEKQESEAQVLYESGLKEQAAGRTIAARQLYAKALTIPVIHEASSHQYSRSSSSSSSSSSSLLHRPTRIKYLALKNTATSFAADAQPSHAIDTFLRALAIDPSDPQVWFSLGCVAREAPDLPIARRAFEEVVERRGADEWVLVELIDVLRRIGDVDAVRAATRRLERVGDLTWGGEYGPGGDGEEGDWSKVGLFDWYEGTMEDVEPARMRVLLREETWNELGRKLLSLVEDGGSELVEVYRSDNNNMNNNNMNNNNNNINNHNSRNHSYPNLHPSSSSSDPSSNTTRHQQPLSTAPNTDPSKHPKGTLTTSESHPSAAVDGTVSSKIEEYFSQYITPHLPLVAPSSSSSSSSSSSLSFSTVPTPSHYHHHHHRSSHSLSPGDITFLDSHLSTFLHQWCRGSHRAMSVAVAFINTLAQHFLQSWPSGLVVITRRIALKLMDYAHTVLSPAARIMLAEMLLDQDLALPAPSPSIHTTVRRLLHMPDVEAQQSRGNESGTTTEVHLGVRWIYVRAQVQLQDAGEVVGPCQALHRIAICPDLPIPRPNTQHLGHLSGDAINKELRELRMLVAVHDAQELGQDRRWGEALGLLVQAFEQDEIDAEDETTMTPSRWRQLKSGWELLYDALNHVHRVHEPEDYRQHDGMGATVSHDTMAAAVAVIVERWAAISPGQRSEYISETLRILPAMSAVTHLQYHRRIAAALIRMLSSRSALDTRVITTALRLLLNMTTGTDGSHQEHRIHALQALVALLPRLPDDTRRTAAAHLCVAEIGSAAMEATEDVRCDLLGAVRRLYGVEKEKKKKKKENKKKKKEDESEEEKEEENTGRGNILDRERVPALEINAVVLALQDTLSTGRSPPSSKSEFRQWRSLVLHMLGDTVKEVRPALGRRRDLLRAHLDRRYKDDSTTEMVSPIPLDDLAIEQQRLRDKVEGDEKGLGYCAASISEVYRWMGWLTMECAHQVSEGSKATKRFAFESGQWQRWLNEMVHAVRFLEVAVLLSPPSDPRYPHLNTRRITRLISASALPVWSVMADSYSMLADALLFRSLVVRPILRGLYLPESPSAAVAVLRWRVVRCLECSQLNEEGRVKGKDIAEACRRSLRERREMGAVRCGRYWLGKDRTGADPVPGDRAPYLDQCIEGRLLWHCAALQPRYEDTLSWQGKALMMLHEALPRTPEEDVRVHTFYRLHAFRFKILEQHAAMDASASPTMPSGPRDPGEVVHQFRYDGRQRDMMQSACISPKHKHMTKRSTTDYLTQIQGLIPPLPDHADRHPGAAVLSRALRSDGRGDPPLLALQDDDERILDVWSNVAQALVRVLEIAPWHFGALFKIGRCVELCPARMGTTGDGNKRRQRLAHQIYGIMFWKHQGKEIPGNMYIDDNTADEYTCTRFWRWKHRGLLHYLRLSASLADRVCLEEMGKRVYDMCVQQRPYMMAEVVRQVATILMEPLPPTSSMRPNLVVLAYALAETMDLSDVRDRAGEKLQRMRGEEKGSEVNLEDAVNYYKSKYPPHSSRKRKNKTSTNQHSTKRQKTEHQPTSSSSSSPSPSDPKTNTNILDTTGKTSSTQ